MTVLDMQAVTELKEAAHRLKDAAALRSVLILPPLPHDGLDIAAFMAIRRRALASLPH